MKKEVFTPKGMKVFGGPVAEAVIAGGFAFVSGQIAWILRQVILFTERSRRRQGQLSAI